MSDKYADIAFTASVKAVQQARGSRAAYARRETGPGFNGRLGPHETQFLSERDGFYIASVSETGWPYVQYRGGPAGFLKVVRDGEIGFADFRGNRQYVTAGNLGGNHRVSLFLMDYPNQRRLKIFGLARLVDPSANPDLIKRLEIRAYPAQVEGAVVIKVQAFDWNCPQHITPRFSEDELARRFDPTRTKPNADGLAETMQTRENANAY